MSWSLGEIAKIRPKKKRTQNKTKNTMPKIYTLEQKKARLAHLEAQITIAKHKWDKKELKRLWNLRGLQKWKWKDDIE